MAEDQKQVNLSGLFHEMDLLLAEILKKGNGESSKKPDLSPKLDPLLVRAIDDVYKTYQPFYVKDPRPIRPDDHYLEIMRLKGWLDLDLNDPDLAPLFK